MALDLDQLRTAAQRVATSHGLDVVEVDFAGGGKHRLLRIFLEKNAEGRARLAEMARSLQEKEGESDEEGLVPLAVLDGSLSIEHLSGVTHEDCESFSRDFGMYLDVEDLVPGAEYMLEVSSPGLDRRLTTASEFERFTGSLAKVQTFSPVDGSRHWKGRIVGFSGTMLTLDLSSVKQKADKSSKKAKAGQLKETDAVTEVRIELSNVEKANLIPEF